MPRLSTPRGEVERGLAYAMNPRLAVHYERHMVDDCHYRSPDVVADALLRFARPRGRWLDLGAGSGLFGRALSKREVALELHAVDISQAMLDLIDDSSYVARHLADATVALPFLEGTFDGVVSIGLLEHVVEPRPVLHNAASVAKPGGAISFTYLPIRDGRTERWREEEGLVSHDVESMRADAEHTGLVIIHESEYPAYVVASRGWVVHRLILALRSSPRESATT